TPESSPASSWLPRFARNRLPYPRLGVDHRDEPTGRVVDLAHAPVRTRQQIALFRIEQQIVVRRPSSHGPRPPLFGDALAPGPERPFHCVHGEERNETGRL